MQKSGLPIRMALEIKNRITGTSSFVSSAPCLIEMSSRCFAEVNVPDLKIPIDAAVVRLTAFSLCHRPSACVADPRRAFVCLWRGAGWLRSDDQKAGCAAGQDAPRRRCRAEVRRDAAPDKIHLPADLIVCAAVQGAD